MSHDWPTIVTKHGDVNTLLKKKPFFKGEVPYIFKIIKVAQNVLGSPYLSNLMQKIKPAHWFSAHLHVGYSALIPHKTGSENKKQKLEGNPENVPSSDIKKTKFLALDKCLPGRDFLF